jgi:DNA mismatch repair ATPase MutS
VQHWYTKLCAANDKIAAACEVEWIAMQHRLSQEHAVSLVAVKQFLEAFAVLDVLRHAFARLARLPMYVKPTLLVADDDANAAICIRQGRHPLAESMLKAVGRTYVASDVVMQPHGTWLLTGPNMGGKSALMRMVGSHGAVGATGLLGTRGVVHTAHLSWSVLPDGQ